MVKDPADARHQTHANLETHWEAGHPQVLPLQGLPWCEMRLDPPAGLIKLLTTYELPEPELANLKNVSFDAVTDGDRDIAEITVRVDGSIHGAYGLLATIADALQLEDVGLAAAVRSGVRRYRDMLAPRAGLSDPEEIGLFGELLLLDFLVGALGAGPAIESWQGPLSEEHDFVFADLHLEVKTTVSERRRHVIGSLEQLVPLSDVPLGLVSIQITRADPLSGRTLAALVAEVRRAADGYSAPLDERLERIGWRPDDADLYPTVWVLRSVPRVYWIDSEFPALSPRLLGPVVPNFGLVSDVSYRVDVTDIEYGAIRKPLADFVQSEGSTAP